MLTRLLLFVALSAWPALATAQDIHVPLGSRQLPGPLVGCRYTEWLPEAYAGPTETVWLIAWNPLPVDQLIEITIYDDGSHLPHAHHVIPAETRTSIDLFAGKSPFLTRLMAISAEVRWQYAGSSALASWPLVYDRPMALSEGKALTICYDR